jgi:hypothetical protein
MQNEQEWYKPRRVVMLLLTMCKHNRSNKQLTFKNNEVCIQG